MVFDGEFGQHMFIAADLDGYSAPPDTSVPVWHMLFDQNAGTYESVVSAVSFAARDHSFFPVYEGPDDLWEMRGFSLSQECVTATLNGDPLPVVEPTPTPTPDPNAPREPLEPDFDRVACARSEGGPPGSQFADSFALELHDQFHSLLSAALEGVETTCVIQLASNGGDFAELHFSMDFDESSTHYDALMEVFLSAGFSESEVVGTPASDGLFGAAEIVLTGLGPIELGEARVAYLTVSATSVVVESGTPESLCETEDSQEVATASISGLAEVLHTGFSEAITGSTDAGLHLECHSSDQFGDIGGVILSYELSGDTDKVSSGSLAALHFLGASTEELLNIQVLGSYEFRNARIGEYEVSGNLVFVLFDELGSFIYITALSRQASDEAVIIGLQP